MNKLNYGNYNASISDIAFSATNGYSDPASELETRKQLSYPLKEVKDFVNNTVTEKNGEAVQLLVTNDNKLQYRTTPEGTPVDIQGLDMSTVINTIYPVGSIYMSVSNTNPSTLFAGTTWTQLKDRFLLGAGDTYSGGSTGGEATHTLTINEIPSHSHSGVVTPSVRGVNPNGGDWELNWYNNSSTNNAGGGQAHNNMPPYLVVYMFKRTA